MKLTKEDICLMWEWERNGVSDSFMPSSEYVNKPVQAVYLSRLREVVSELKSKHKVTNSDADDDYLFGYNEGKKDLFKTFDELFGEVLK